MLFLIPGSCLGPSQPINSSRQARATTNVLNHQLNRFKNFFTDVLAAATTSGKKGSLQHKSTVTRVSRERNQQLGSGTARGAAESAFESA